ncbi:MAG: hypothetical protein WD627_08280 [Actinomycetota bacterium]
MALLLLLAACGGNEPRSATTTTAAPSTVVESTQPATAAPSPSPEAPSTTAPAATTRPRTSATTVPAQPALATGPAKPGQYLFDEKGLIKTLGCLTSNQQPPSPSRLNVAPPNGSRQQIDRDQSGPGIGSTTNLVLEYRDDGAYLVSLKQSMSVAGQSVVFDFEANPPVLTIPSRPRTGQTGGFTLTSRDGQVKIEASWRVEGLNEPVTLGSGAAANAHRLVTTSRITGTSSQGSLNVTVQRVSWYSPESHLEIKESTDTSGTVGLCRVDFHIESLARSLDPG